AGVAPPPLTLHDQAGSLKRLLDEGVGNTHPVLPPRRLVEVPHVPAPVTLAVKPQDPLHLADRHASGRRTPPTTIEKSLVAPLLEPDSIPPHRPGAQAQDLRRLKPVDLSRQRLQDHLLHLH